MLKTKHRASKKLKMPSIQLIEKLELPLQEPVWYPTAVKSGQRISIKAIVEYLNISPANNRKAVLLVRAYNEAGEEVDVSLESMFRSDAFDAHFKYLASTQGEVEELYTFVVPEGVTTIHFGFNRFLCSENEQVLISDLTIYPEVETELTKKLETADSHFIEKLELPLQEPVWYPTAVKSGQRISIKAIVEYLNISPANNRKAVLLVRAYNEAGEEVDVSLESMFRSDAFDAHFKYLASTQGEVEELYTFVVPEGVTTIHFGFNRFLCSEEEQVVVSDLTIRTETEIEIRKRFEKIRTQTKETHLDLSFYKNTSKYFSLERFISGKYKILVIHRNKEVFKNRKALILFLNGLSDKTRSKRNLPISDLNKQAFNYMGSGLEKDGVFYQDFYLDVDSSLENCKLYFYCTLPDFKIDKFIIENNTQDKVTSIKDISKPQNQWSNIKLSNVNTSQLEFLLYADINANVVDGSSVWYSSMASILAAKGKTAVILKENLRHRQIVSNIENSENVQLITPEKIGYDGVLNIEQGVDLLRKIDDISPNVRIVVVRGCEVAYQLSQTRQFFNRLASYITDFYTIENNKLLINEEKAEKIKLISNRSVYSLVQTQSIKNKLNDITQCKLNYIEIPPPINEKFFSSSYSKINELESNSNQSEDKVLKIGYAGKITPGWGVFELFEFVERLKHEGVNVKLYIAANKISSPTNLQGFRREIKNWFKKLDVNYYNDFNREQSIEMLSKMDFIWCFRPAGFENSTLELSTKLVESVAIGGRSLCYPSAINIASLGKDYPFFIEDYNDFKRVLNQKDLQVNNEYSKNIWQKHSLKKISENFHSYFLSEPMSENKLLFASHDFKFIDAYISYLKSKGVPVKKEIWEWGGHKNAKQLLDGYNWADTIFCEWGLANAVWYSNNNPDNKPVYVRVHAQEVRERAQKFGRQINTSNIEKFIFVSKNIRDQAIELFDYRRNQTEFIPNFVMDNEFYFSKRKKNNNSVVLGILGFVPQTKRLDRAVLLLDSLRKSGIDAKLSVKGHRPEELEFMHAPSRVKELDYYYDTYKLIDSLGLIEYVSFEGWGANVRDWYEKIDVILSPSENESFHYALADGVLSGCLPVIWNWEEAKVIYLEECVISGIGEAQDLIESYISKTDINSLKLKNRKYLVNNFGYQKVFNYLNKSIFN